MQLPQLLLQRTKHPFSLCIKMFNSSCHYKSVMYILFVVSPLHFCAAMGCHFCCHTAAVIPFCLHTFVRAIVRMCKLVRLFALRIYSNKFYAALVGKGKCFDVLFFWERECECLRRGMLSWKNVCIFKGCCCHFNCLFSNCNDIRAERNIFLHGK